MPGWGAGEAAHAAGSRAGEAGAALLSAFTSRCAAGEASLQPHVRPACQHHTCGHVMSISCPFVTRSPGLQSNLK